MSRAGVKCLFHALNFMVSEGIVGNPKPQNEEPVIFRITIRPLQGLDLGGVAVTKAPDYRRLDASQQTFALAASLVVEPWGRRMKTQTDVPFETN